MSFSTKLKKNHKGVHSYYVGMYRLLKYNKVNYSYKGLSHSSVSL